MLKFKSLFFVQFTSLRLFLILTLFSTSNALAQAYNTSENSAQFPNVYEKKELDGSGTFIQWDGHYRARGLVQDNFVNGNSDYVDEYSHRLRINGNFAPSDDLKAYFSANIHGQFGGSKNGNLGLDQSLVNSSSQDHELQLLTAYGEWDFWRGFYLNFGRQQLSWVNEAMFSTNEDDNRPYSFDGVVLNYTDSAVSFQLGALRLGDWASQTSSEIDPSEDSYFVSVQLSGYLDLLKEAQLFFFRTQSDSYFDAPLGINILGGSFNRFGASINGENAFLFYTLDYINQSGDFNGGQASSANMGHLKLGGIWGSKDQLRTYFIGHIDTGDDASSTGTDEGYRPLYYNHHKYAGLMDLFSWGNLTYYGVGFEYKPDEAQTFLLQALSFQRSDKSTGVSSIDYLGFDQGFITQDINQNANGVDERDLGMEIDFLYRKNYGKNAYLEFIAGAFIPADYFNSYGRDKNIYSVRLTTGFNF